MANLKDIKGRIQSVQSTQKITNAMKLVSAAKFARANHAVEAARPYNEAFFKMIASLLAAQKGQPGFGEGSEALEKFSPFLKSRPEKKILVVMVATDRGLCGGLNSNLLKAAHKFVAGKQAEGIRTDVMPCGRRAILFSRKMKYQVVASKEKVLERSKFRDAEALADELIKFFLEGGYDSIYLAYASYVSALEQIPTVDQFLPIDISAVDLVTDSSGPAKDLIVEPRLDHFLDHLLHSLLYGIVYNVLLNGSASEHGARMTAMDAATNNAKEVIRKLTLQYNRARQAAITTELTEIISGAEALN